MATHQRPMVAAAAALAGRGASGRMGAGSRASAESLSQRSLFIRVRPAPTTLSERRSVLRVLERHGKTEMFKKLVDNASFIAIASTAATASALINRSPIQYEFLSETFETMQPWGDPRAATLVQPIETGRTREGEAAETAGSRADTNRRRQTDQVQHKSFVVSVFPSQDYRHQTMIRLSPLHGSWPKDFSAVMAPSLTGRGNAAYKNTFVYNALRAVVPDSAASEGLCDWRVSAADVSVRAAATRESESGGSGSDDSSGRSSGTRDAAYIQQRKGRKLRFDRSTIAGVLARSSRSSNDDDGSSGSNSRSSSNDDSDNSNSSNGNSDSDNSSSKSKSVDANRDEDPFSVLLGQ